MYVKTSDLTSALLAAAALAVTACAEPVEVPVAREAPNLAQPRKNVRRVPVPYGTRLPCESLLHADALSEHLGREVSIAASDGFDRDATSLCWVSERAPTSTGPRRRAKPPARICHLTVYCSYIYDAQTERDRCSAADGAADLALGAAGCRYSAPPKVDVLDADSQCRIVVHPASERTDVVTLAACASAAAAELSPSRLRPDGGAVASASR